MFTLRLKELMCIGATIGLVGCGSGAPSFSLLPDGQSFKQSSSGFNNQLDILFVIDNSGSMDNEQLTLANNFAAFMGDFQTKGYDFKIAVTGTDAYLANSLMGTTISTTYAQAAKFRDGPIRTDSGSYSLMGTHSGVFVILPSTPNIFDPITKLGVFPTNIKQGVNGSGDERAFSSFMTSLNSPLNAGFLRSKSFLAVIIVSDEDDFSDYTRTLNAAPDHSYTAASLHSIQSYVDQLDSLTGTTGASRRYNVSNISPLDTACAPNWMDSHLPNRMVQLTNATNGISGSICDATFATSLNQIQSKISELSTQFFLDRVPVVETIYVKVNDVPISQDAANGWTYDSTANSIVFHGSSIPAQGADIYITFQPTTIK